MKGFFVFRCQNVVSGYDLVGQSLSCEQWLQSERIGTTPADVQHNHIEALDLTVYCHAGLFVLQNFAAPAIYRDVGKLAEIVAQGQLPETVRHRTRRVSSPGFS